MRQGPPPRICSWQARLLDVLGVKVVRFAMRTLILLPIALFMIPALACAPDDEDARLAAFFSAYLAKEHELYPFVGSRRGDRSCDHRLEDLSNAAGDAALGLYKKTLDELPKAIAYSKLSRGGQIDYEILKLNLQRDYWVQSAQRPYVRDPRVYVEYLTESTYGLFTQSSAPKAVNTKNAISRMAYLPRIVAAAKKNLQHPPRIWTETAIQRTEGAINYYKDNIYLVAGETPQLSEISKATPPVIAALEEFLTFLREDLLPRSDGDWRLGKQRFYQKMIHEMEGAFPADQIVAEAEREAERVVGEMYVIARQLWHRCFPGQPLPTDDRKRETIALVIQKVSQDHGDAVNLVRDIKQTVEEVKTFIRARDILRLPEPDRCQIIEMPEFQRGFSVAYCNNAPPLDTQANTYYAISPPPRDWDERRRKSYLEEYNRHMLKILTIHEAYPGHFVQLEYANRRPSLIRRVLSSGVFAEGWAVYTEQMMLDQGFGDGDLALRLNQLKFYLRAVVNAILDYKMHCENLSDEDAMKLLVGRAFQSEGEAAGKVIRAKLSACQLSTYFTGRMAFYKLRQEIQKEQGEKFDLGRYHEAVLDHGTLPVKFLPELVRERIERPR
jgi:uncharacterized protein (DUF885 family)